jgi:hypothetical protein
LTATDGGETDAENGCGTAADATRSWLVMARVATTDIVVPAGAGHEVLMARTPAAPAVMLGGSKWTEGDEEVRVSGEPATVELVLTA